MNRVETLARFGPTIVPRSPDGQRHFLFISGRPLERMTWAVSLGLRTASWAALQAAKLATEKAAVDHD
jgi:hypothetical protein